MKPACSAGVLGIVLAAASVAAAPPPVAVSAASVLAHVEQRYGKANQLSASFRQTVTNATFQTSKTSDGRLWVLKPSSVRCDYLARRGGAVVVTKSFLFDGMTLWLVDHDNRQIVARRTRSGVLPAAVAFLTGGSALSSQYDAALDTSGRFGHKGTVVLALTPKQPSAAYRRLFFVVARSDWHVVASIVIDSDGDTNAFQFVAPDLRARVNPRWFQVNPAALPNYQLVP